MNRRFLLTLFVVMNISQAAIAQSPETDATAVRNVDVSQPAMMQRGIAINRAAAPMGHVGRPMTMTFISPGAGPVKLFPPELIMRNQDRLNLTARQVTAIKNEMKTYQSGMVDIQWALSEAQTKLDNELSNDSIDEDRALALVDSVMEAENDMKKSHMALLIRVRNILDDSQLDELQKLGGLPGRGMAMPFTPYTIMP